MMKIKNNELQGFIGFLMEFELAGKSSRMRTRFCKLLSKRLEDVEEERLQLVQQFAIKNEKDEPIIVKDNNDNSVYKVADHDGFANEYSTLMNEFYYIDQTLDFKEMFLTIQEIVLNCEKTFKGIEALDYDRWCEIVEEIKYTENDEE